MIGFDPWRMPVQWLMVGIAVYLVAKSRHPFSLKLLVGYFCAHVLWVGFHPNFTSPMIPMVSDYVRMGALHAYIMFVLYLNISRQPIFKKYFIPFSAFYVVLDLSWCAASGNPNSGMMTAVTQSTAMATCFAPIFCKQKYYLPIAAVIAAIFYFKAATAVLCLGAMGIFYILYYSKKIAALLVIFSVGAYKIVSDNTDFLNPGSRIAMWKKYIYFWDHSEAYAFGLGFGGWDAFSRFIKIGDVEKDKVFFLFHNDWLQMLVEGGFIGFGLCVYVFIAALRGARFQIEVACSLVGFAIVMMFYSPLRFAIGQLFIVYLLTEAFKHTPIKKFKENIK